MLFKKINLIKKNIFSIYYWLIETTQTTYEKIYIYEAFNFLQWSYFLKKVEPFASLHLPSIGNLNDIFLKNFFRVVFVNDNVISQFIVEFSLIDCHSIKFMQILDLVNLIRFYAVSNVYL